MLTAMAARARRRHRSTGRVPNMAALTQLTAAPFTTEPNFSRTPALRALPHNGSWADDLSPATTTRKLAGYTIEYPGMQAWGLQRADGGYYLCVVNQSTELYNIVNYVPGVGESGVLTFPNPQPTANIIGAVMSAVDPVTCYGMCSDLKLRKYIIGASSITEVVGGVWPKDISGTGNWAGAGVFPAWLRMSYDDRKFSFSSDTLDGVWVFDAQANSMVSLTGAALRADGSIPNGWGVNEAYLAFAGDFVSVALSPGDNVLWDLTTGFHSKLGPHFSHGQVMDGGIWAPYFWNRPGALADMAITEEGRGYSTFAPVLANGAAHPAPVHTELTNIYASTYEGSYDHATTFWRQAGTAFALRWVFGGQYSGIFWATNGDGSPIAWLQDVGNVYKRQPTTNSVAVPPRVMVECDGTNAATGKLTKVANRAALVSPGQWCLHSDGWIYAWRSDSAVVSFDNVGVMAGAATSGTIGTQQAGRGDARHIAWHYQHPNDLTYGEALMANVCQDGSLLASNSDLGKRGGPLSLLIHELPVLP